MFGWFLDWIVSRVADAFVMTDERPAHPTSAACSSPGSTSRAAGFDC
jgi:hypothetical protein